MTTDSKIEEKEKKRFGHLFPNHHDVRCDEVKQRILFDDESTASTIARIDLDFVDEGDEAGEDVVDDDGEQKMIAFLRRHRM